MTDSYVVPVEEAMQRLAVIEDYDDGGGPRPCVHTFMSSSFGLMGAHWGVDDARRAFETWGVEEAGEQAQAMKHGLVCIEERSGRKVPVFFETVALPLPRTDAPNAIDAGSAITPQAGHNDQPKEDR